MIDQDPHKKCRREVRRIISIEMRKLDIYILANQIKIRGKITDKDITMTSFLRMLIDVTDTWVAYHNF